MSQPTQIHHRTCPLCEATCGLLIETEADQVHRIKPDPNDPFSQGYMCAKARALGDLHADPDRLRSPMIRRNGRHESCSWPEAFEAIGQGFARVKEKHSVGAIGVYQGNPSVHRPSIYLYSLALLRALRTRHIYSASSVDQLPKQWSSALMFGSSLSVAVPDIDRTDYLLILGANPLVSNGSLWTAPDLRGRIKRLLKRGGKLVVIDPARTQTAATASEHLFIEPGADAFFLLAIVQVLFADQLLQTGRLSDLIQGLDLLREQVQEFTPERVSVKCGIAATDIRRLAHELAAAKTAVVYGRMGTCTQAFGSLGSWLIDVINILTGNLDRLGGAMFADPVALASNQRFQESNPSGVNPSRRTSRVAGLPVVLGEQPVITMADEILSPGKGSMRALITIAGNPVLSTPDSVKLQKALSDLEFMVSIDIYCNETTQFADVILPGLSPLEDSHYDYVFASFMVRQYARYSEPVFVKSPDSYYEWQLLLILAELAAGRVVPDQTREMDDRHFTQWIKNVGRHPQIPAVDFDTIWAELGDAEGPERIIDLLIRLGPQGDAFGSRPTGLTLAKLKQSPSGIDFGPLQSQLPGLLRTKSRKIELAPAPIVSDLERLRSQLAKRPTGLMLIGRREILSNNSWMHNLSRLNQGKQRCTLFMNPEDARKYGIQNEQDVQVKSATGQIRLPARITDAIKPGVVSIPHGWGHSNANGLAVARAHPGVNMNELISTTAYDHPSGNAVLNGIPVEIRAAD